MTLFTPEERRFASLLQRLSTCNPFVAERITLERLALGADFDPAEASWNVRHDLTELRLKNLALITERGSSLARVARDRLASGGAAKDDERALYHDLAQFVLYHRYLDAFQTDIRVALEEASAPMAGSGAKSGAVSGEASRRATKPYAFWPEFERDARELLDIPGVALPESASIAQAFALFFQLNRAFATIYFYIVGGSDAATRLRAAIWQSIFTHDLRRYRRALYDRLGDVPTLITGPSGTGKELVARAIGLSRFIPFDPKARAFRVEFATSFFPVNLSALSPTLIESELFGHRRGAFSGALDDRKGYLEVCPDLGTVFLDELGELATELQVKLLRVLQTRTFQRIGETETRRFRGKVIAATNRDLAAAMRDGRFREDLYYRLCADLIVTPSLKEQLSDAPDDLEQLVRFIARGVAGPEADALAAEVVTFIRQDLGSDYPWPGNFRELEQCVRNVLIRRAYRPTRRPAATDLGDAGLDRLADEGCTADDVLRRYVTLVHRRAGTFEEAARRLGMDRRTVKSKVLHPGRG